LPAFFLRLFDGRSQPIHGLEHLRLKVLEGSELIAGLGECPGQRFLVVRLPNRIVRFFAEEHQVLLQFQNRPAELFQHLLTLGEKGVFEDFGSLFFLPLQFFQDHRVCVSELLGEEQLTAADAD